MALDIVFYDLDSNQAILLYDKIIFGRSQEVDVTLDSGMVSSKHCQLFISKKKELSIMDLNSKNQTIVNGDPIIPNEKTPLNPDDIVQIGQYRFLCIDNYDPNKQISKDQVSRLISQKETEKSQEAENIQVTIDETKANIKSLEEHVAQAHKECLEFKRSAQKEVDEFVASLENMRKKYVERVKIQIEKNELMTANLEKEILKSIEHEKKILGDWDAKLQFRQMQAKGVISGGDE